jgi:hypothetical protein
VTTAELMLCALDPVEYAKYCGLVPDKWQDDMLRDARALVMACTSRQVGKSTITGVKASHALNFRPGSMILVTAPTVRQAGELFHKIKKTYLRFPKAPPLVKETANTLETVHGSRLVCVPGKGENIAGFSAVDIAIIDEACYADDTLFSVLSPMLAVSRGQMVLISTPFTKDGFFFESWHDEKLNNIGRYRVPWWDCPRIPHEFIEQEKRKLGPWWFASQYECEFQAAQDQVFKDEWLKAALGEDEGFFMAADTPDSKRYGDSDSPLFSDEEFGAIVKRSLAWQDL